MRFKSAVQQVLEWLDEMVEKKRGVNLMKTKDTILSGCEVLCLTGGLVACPLPDKVQKVCKGKLQYEAGREAERKHRLERPEREMALKEVGKQLENALENDFVMAIADPEGITMESTIDPLSIREIIEALKQGKMPEVEDA